MGKIGSTELILILIVALLVFGKRLPDIARQAGKALSEFRRSFNELKYEITDNSDSNIEIEEPDSEETAKN